MVLFLETAISLLAVKSLRRSSNWPPLHTSLYHIPMALAGVLVVQKGLVLLGESPFILKGVHPCKVARHRDSPTHWELQLP